MAEFTNKQKLREVRKELGFRYKVFKGLVESGKMTREESRRRIRIMQEIAADYERLHERETKGGDLFDDEDDS